MAETSAQNRRDGEELTKHMIQFNVGVRIARTVDVKRIDLDYFEDIETE